ncbi:ABC transporter substrate-binding protein [Trebonia sp.]|uniref:ABC transporter substrate-binding protein n=1 Tax=Trebonia sp. TaxID=2767075 RepID=UPI003BB2014D
MSAVALSVGVLAACSGGGSSSSLSAGATGPASTGPITIGASLSLHGGFTADGVAFKEGYELWAKDVNAHGGIMGRKVELTILDNKSSPNLVVTDYQTLINTTTWT